MIFNLDEFLKGCVLVCHDPYTSTNIYRAEDVYDNFLFCNDLQDDEYVYYMFERRMTQEKLSGVAFIG